MSEFRVIKDFPNYEIDETGNVRRCVRSKFGHRDERIPYISTTGYYYLVLRDGKRHKACAVHRLVAQAFIGEQPADKPFVAHFDGDKLNNHVTNLRWVNRSENEHDKVHQGRSNRGERFGRHVLSKASVVQVKTALFNGEPVASIAKRVGAAVTTIKSIKQGVSWFWLEKNGAENHTKTSRRPARQRQAQGALL